MSKTKINDTQVGREDRKIGWNASSVLSWPFRFFGSILSGLWQGLLGLFGIHPRAPDRQHMDLDMGDVDHEMKIEREKQSAAAHAADLDGPATVLSYALASPEARADIDLGALTPDQTDWLLGLSDSELALIGMSGPRGASMSLSQGKIVLKLPKQRKAVQEPDALQAQPEASPKTDWQIIREGFLNAVRNDRRILDDMPERDPKL